MPPVKERMPAATAWLAEMARSARLTQTGIPATATITTVSQTPTMINHQPVKELGLLAIPPGGVPYAAGCQFSVPMISLAQCQPGATVAVLFDASNPASVAVRWGQTA